MSDVRTGRSAPSPTGPHALFTGKKSLPKRESGFRWPREPRRERSSAAGRAQSSGTATALPTRSPKLFCTPNTGVEKLCSRFGSEPRPRETSGAENRCPAGSAVVGKGCKCFEAHSCNISSCNENSDARPIGFSSMEATLHVKMIHETFARPVRERSACARDPFPKRQQKRRKRSFGVSRLPPQSKAAPPLHSLETHSLPPHQRRNPSSKKHSALLLPGEVLDTLPPSSHTFGALIFFPKHSN